MLFYLAAAAYVAVHRVNFVPLLIADMLIPQESPPPSPRAPIERCLEAGVMRLERRRGRDGLVLQELGIISQLASTDSADRVARWRQRQRQHPPRGDPAVGEDFHRSTGCPRVGDGDFHISTDFHSVTLPSVTCNALPNAVGRGAEVQDRSAQIKSVVQEPGLAAELHSRLADRDWRRLCAVARREVQTHPELADWPSRLEHVKTVCVRARLPGANTLLVGRALEAVLARGRR